jgi:addiction module RelE/StbE family toxin
MKVVIRESACRDLENIFDWIARDNPEAARKVSDRILSAIENLGDFPGLGHSGKVVGTREWLVRGTAYLIVYTVETPPSAIRTDDDILDVVAVFHGAQNREQG